jgi:hypothetical protein
MHRWCPSLTRVLSLAIALSLAASLALPPVAAGQAVEESVNGPGSGGQPAEGRIDWSDHTLVVYGEGVAPTGVDNPGLRRLLGQRAAKTVAYRNLLELVGQVRVDAETQVSLAMVTSDTIRTRVAGLVQGATVVPGSLEERDGVYRVALRLKLTDDFLRALLPVLGGPAAATSPLGAPVTSSRTAAATGAPDAAPARDPASPPPAGPTSRFDVVRYTGLLVDARGLDLRPGLAPRVLDPEGRVVFTGAGADAGYAASMGIAGYLRDWDQALVSDRFGAQSRNPLIVKAIAAVGNNRTDAVVSDEDRVRIAMADAVTGFLRQCRVVFVVGPAAETTAPVGQNRP